MSERENRATQSCDRLVDLLLSRRQGPELAGVIMDGPDSAGKPEFSGPAGDDEGILRVLDRVAEFTVTWNSAYAAS